MNNLCQLLTTLVLYKEGKLLTVLRILFSSNQNGSVFFSSTKLVCYDCFRSSYAVNLNWRQCFGNKKVVQRKCHFFIVSL